MSLPFRLHFWIFQLSISCLVWFYLLRGYVFHLSNEIINSYGLEATSSISWHALKNLSWFLECGRWLINASWCTDGLPGKVKAEGRLGPWSWAHSNELQRGKHISVFTAEGHCLVRHTTDKWGCWTTLLPGCRVCSPALKMVAQPDGEILITPPLSSSFSQAF